MSSPPIPSYPMCRYEIRNNKLYSLLDYDNEYAKLDAKLFFLEEFSQVGSLQIIIPNFLIYGFFLILNFQIITQWYIFSFQPVFCFELLQRNFPIVFSYPSTFKVQITPFRLWTYSAVIIT